MKIYNLRKTGSSINLRKLKKSAALCISLLFIISIFTVSTARAAPTGVTSVFSSGFEDGFNSWTSASGGVSVVSSPIYSGSYAMRCSDPWGSQATESIGTQSEAYTEAEFNFDHNFAGSQTLIAYFNGNGNPSAIMGLSVQSGKVYLFVEAMLPSYQYAQYPLTGVTPGTWYNFALDVSASSATIYLNDQKLTSVSQTNIPATATVKIGMFWGDGAYSGNLYIDNVQISGSSGGTSDSTPTPSPSPNPTSSTSSFSPDQCSTTSITPQSETYTEAQFSFDHNYVGSQTLIAYFNSNGNPSVSMGISAQSGRVFVFVEDKLPSYVYAQYQLTGITPGSWYKFALDASATSATIYMNDQKLTSISQANIPATATVKIGLLWGDWTYTGNLLVNSVKIGSSSGSTSSPTSTPTPSPSPTPTPAPSSTPTPTTTPTPTSAPTYSGNSLPLSALGDDYLVWSNWNGDPNYWKTQLHWFTEYHCNTARLGVSLPNEPVKECSTYDKAKLNTVLSLLSSVGVKVILTDQNGDTESWYGSQAWINDWKQIATDFAGDTRIEAFEICGETYSQFWNPSIYGSWSLSHFDQACADCINQIRAVDSSRTIMYPIVVGVITDSTTAFYNDLVAHGIPAKGNILYDITHPYFFQGGPAMDFTNDPITDADAIWYSYCLPQIALFGVANCWCGETFPWASTSYIGGNPANGQYSYALQQEFEVAMINHFVSAGMGFQMWCFFSRTDQQTDIDALNNSNYYTLIHS